MVGYKSIHNTQVVKIDCFGKIRLYFDGTPCKSKYNLFFFEWETKNRMFKH